MPRLGIFHVIVRRRRRPHIADRVGVALTEKSSRPTRRIARKREVNATLPNKRRLAIGEIVNRQAVGAVSMEKSSRVRRNNVRTGAASISLHKKKQSSIAGRAGSAWTENLFECLRRKLERESFNVMLRNKKPLRVASRAGAAFKDPPARSLSRPTRRIARDGEVSATIPKNKRKAVALIKISVGAALTQRTA
jgi:hypothetical protein